jgi:hypothetical protein
MGIPDEAGPDQAVLTARSARRAIPVGTSLKTACVSTNGHGSGAPSATWPFARRARKREIDAGEPITHPARPTTARWVRENLSVIVEVEQLSSFTART